MAKAYNIAKAYRNKIAGKNKELSAQRMAICNECELLVLGVCQVCLCVMSVKTTLKEEQCPHPDGPKWDKVI